jgi:hypothetical protein
MLVSNTLDIESMVERTQFRNVLSALQTALAVLFGGWRLSTGIGRLQSSGEQTNMRITAYAISGLLAVTLFGVQLAGQDARTQGAEGRDAFANRQEFSKGGIGMVNKNLYIVVKSAKKDRNELVVKPTEETEESWKGKGVSKAEVAIVYEGKVWSPEALPKRFDLSKAVIVSFEESKIRFFDFQRMSGEYFDRISD